MYLETKYGLIFLPNLYNFNFSAPSTFNLLLSASAIY